MPFGFKLETEENVLKSIELAKNLDKKKQKIIQKNSEYSKRSAKNDNSDLYSIENSYHSNKKSLRDRKPTTREDLGYVDKSLKGKSAAAKIIQRKCEKGLIKIKNNFTDEMKYEDRVADEKLRELAQKESDCVGDDRIFRNIEVTEKSKERVEILEKIKQLEKEGKFDVDAEDDPPTIELTPENVDYLKTKRKK